jgi:hypothetical protein
MILRNTYILIILFTLTVYNISAQQYTISGYVHDENTGESLIGASIYESKSQIGITTNTYGFYSITLKTIPAALEVSYIGYQKKEVEVQSAKNTQINVKLTPETVAMNEVKIIAERGNPVKTNTFNIEVLTPKTIEMIPIAFGETDMIKALQQKAGVTSLGEGSSGLFVQGGNTDQNLILIDEAQVYNPSHLFGLVSVFNPDAIKNVEFYKGAIPAEFGGRLSSIISSQMKDGNKQNHSLSGGVGTMTTHFALEGPVKKDTSSYLLAIRRSIRDLFQNPGKENVVYVPQFYDVNAKLNWNVNNKNRLFFSLYHGNDKIKSDNDFLNTWGNTTCSFRWNKTFSNRLFMNFSSIYSNYNNDMKYIAQNKTYSWFTGVEDIFGKLNFTWFVNHSNKVKFGIESVYHKYKPGENDIKEQSLFRINAIENSFYILNDIDITSWLGVNYGFRYSLFQDIGNAEWYTYDDFLPTGVESNDKGVYKTYPSFEPRATLNIKITPDQVFKMAYSRTSQFSTVLQNSLFSYTSIQTWMPSTPNIKPLYANIYSLGYFNQFAKAYQVSLEAYLKNMYNVCDYIERAQLINYPYIESQIRTGNGKAYGISFLTSRKGERLDVDFSYTFSRVLYKINGINNSMEYPALHDIPHDFRLTTIYKPTKRIGISTYFTLHSGYVLTLPVGFNFDGDFIYTSRNSGRFSLYHRLDLSVFLYPKQNAKKWKGTWSAGVYNIYNKFNPIGANFSAGHDDEVYVYTLYRMIPYISYNFSF